MAEHQQENIKHRLNWIIIGVTQEKLEKSEFILVSDSFSTNLGSKIINWRAYIEHEKEGYLSAGLNLISPGNKDLKLKFDITMNDYVRAQWKKGHKIKFGNGMQWSKIIAIETLFDPSLKYFTDGSTLKLNFDMEILHQDDEDDETPSKNTYTKLFNDASLTDFTLISSDGKSFKVHRAVLAVESEFFNTMFTIDMKEKQQGSVKFDDINSEALMQVLDFIYNNVTEIENVEKAKKVIYAAEKFNLPALKEICCDILDAKICKDNVIQLLAIADMYNAKKLMDVCLKQIVAAFDVVKETEGWKSLTVPLFTKIAETLNAVPKIQTKTLRSAL